MDFVLKDILNYIKKNSPGEFSYKDFWKCIFKAADIPLEKVKDHSVSRWTNGKNFPNEYREKIESSSYKLEKAIQDLFDENSPNYCCNEEEIRDIFNKHQIYSLLEVEESSTIPTIIISIITNFSRLKPQGRLDSIDYCFQNFPYLRQEISIIPITDVQKKMDIILKKYSFLIVQGLPGIGKLSQITYFVQEKKYKYYYYMIFDTSLRKTISAYNFEFAYIRTVKEPEEAYFEENLKYLNKLEEKPLLIIDNIGNNIQNDPDFKTLIHINAIIVFITTHHYFIEENIIEIPPLNNAQCLTLFMNNCRRLPEAELSASIFEELLAYINSHTLSLTLIAKLIQNSALSLEDVIRQLKQCKLPDSGTKILQVQKNQTIKEDTYRNLILQIFDIEAMEDELLQVLKQCALLPLSGYGRISFNHLINDLDSNKINALYSLGWININQQQNTIFMHPILRSCIREQFHLSPTSYSDFLKAYVTRIDMAAYDNEIEEMLLGMELLNEMFENSQFWFEVFYVILAFLKSQRLELSYMKKLLNKYRQMELGGNLDIVIELFCRHIEITYQLYDNQSLENVLKTIALTKNIIDFCELNKNFLSPVFMDLLLSAYGNLEELQKVYEQNSLECLPDSYIGYFITLKRGISSHFRNYCEQLKEKLCSKTGKEFEGHIIPFRIAFYIPGYIGKIWNEETVEFLNMRKELIKGLTSIYKSCYEEGLSSLYNVCNYFQKYDKYEFNYHNLHAQYLILWCQKKLNRDIDEEILNFLTFAFKSIPELLGRSEQYQILKKDFENEICS